jgi:POT family proton-dependent oligopeptide transporter
MAEQSSAAAMERHPPGLAYLAFTELWERFSYYGMNALLALYMTKELLLPGHAENVLGLGPLRELFEFRGSMSNVAFASLVFGWYGGLVYFTPIVGGLIADRWLGAKRTVTIGALLMAGGHLAMSLDQTFLIALILLICGSGCLKGNITSQVGALYPDSAQSLRDRGYTIFSTAINIGAVLGPLATGALASAYGWHAGFSLAAGLMLVALAVYLAGQRHLPQSHLHETTGQALPRLQPADRKQLLALTAVIAMAVPASIAFFMASGLGLIWADQYVQLQTSLGTMPTAWLIALNSLASIVVAPALIALWARQARRLREPHGLTKMAVGSAIIGGSAMLFATGSLLSPEPGSVHLGWALAGYTGMGFGFMWYWPVLLALVSGNAPKQVNATTMGVTFMALFVASVGAGWLGTNYERMSPAAFWALTAAVAMTGTVLLMALGKPLHRRLRPATSQPG